ncbi:MAG: hypothetical protein K2X93_16885 [Candidatus Obscuribacterales bacterium]|nr:hypothetical protein [Candidatus Obscuribacterales bacterium]
MTNKPKRLNILGALGDFTILVLLIGGAGFAGYYIGINQRLAPVQLVWPGTPGAVPLSQVLQPQSGVQTREQAHATSNTPAPAAAATSPPASTTQAPAPAVAPVSNVKQHKTKYWLSSSGTDYIGYSITVKVNDKPVDNFFGPGKTIDITRFVNKGKNVVVFDSKAMGESYNQHTGDGKASLTVQLVSGPTIKEDYAQSAVLLSCKRNASETQDYSENLSFTSKE